MILYRKATKNDLKSIAKVHSSCFKGYFLTSLGSSLLEKYYGEYIAEDAPFVLAFDGDELAGFCLGYISGSKARDVFESKYKFQLALRLLYLCALCSKDAWTRVLLKLKTIFKPLVSKNNSAPADVNRGGILSICVTDKFRGSDIATTLLEKVENEFRMLDIKICTLSVFASNDRARAFYKKTGYEIRKEDNENVMYIKNLT